MNIFDKISKILKEHPQIALCTIIDTKGSTPMKVGAKIIVCPDGKIIGTIGGGAFEKAVIENALHCLKENSSKIFVYHLTKDYQMCCGGTINVFIDIIYSPSKIYIFGAGHVGKSLAQFALLSGFDVFLIDDRDEILKPFYENENFNKVHLIHTPFIEYLINLSIKETQNSYCVILTYNHQIDRTLLLHSISKSFKYIGMIGSRRKVEVSKKFLLQNNVPEDIIKSIDMPIGININAYYPEEIAISILAKIISIKNTHLKGNNKLSESEKIIPLQTQNLEICLKNL